MGQTRHSRKTNNTQHGMKHPVTDNMGHRRHRRKANNTQQGMKISHADVSLPFIIDTALNRLYNTII
jgi:hypothetical protein